jgi:hypothetical protein
MLFIEHFPEFLPARNELNYQKKVQIVNAALKEAIPLFDHVNLDRYLAEAKALSMLPTLNPTQAEATALVAKINQVRTELATALDSADPGKLANAIEFCGSFKYETTQVDNARKFLDCIKVLQNGLDTVDTVKLEAGLKTAMELHMNENKTVNAARASWTKISNAGTKAVAAIETCDATISSSGVTDQHHTSLTKAMAVANNMTGIPEIDRVKELLAQLEAEKKVTEDLKTAVNHDGWYNTDVRPGQYDQYQDASFIDTTQLESATASADRLGKLTERAHLRTIGSSNPHPP